MNNIRSLREKAGLTQVQLAENVGVSQAAVSEWELGKADPSYETLKRLAPALKVSFDVLMCDKEVEA